MTLKELQEVLYEMLCEIDDACRKENVSYSLGGGTLLGAVRSHDFIPWDDDIDLAVWLRDYPSMKDALRRHLPPHMRLVEPADFAPDFWDFVCRVQDTRYHWHTPGPEDCFYENRQNYVSVDIFVISPAAHSRAGLAVQALQYKVLYGLALGHRHAIDMGKYSLLQKAEVRLLSSLGRKFPMEALLRQKERLDHKYDGSPGKYCIINNNIPQYMGLPYERSWFEGTVPLLFHGRLFPVQKGYHQKLTLQYGDYMTPDHQEAKYIIHADCEDSPPEIADSPV